MGMRGRQRSFCLHAFDVADV